MAATVITSRICKCGCGERFTPHPSRPGTEYCYAHKPKKAPADPAKQPAQEKERVLLDYRLTVATLRREIQHLDKEIEALDAMVDDCRKAQATFQATKDRAIDRHLMCVTALDTLQALIDGRSLASLVGTVEAT